MNKPIRVLIIWLSVAFFLVTGAYLYLYSQGIRVDLAKWRLVKTGGFEIQITSPSGVDIYLNGKKNKTTGFLSNSVFIKNLLPKTYKVEIKKAGYLTWQKSLLVEKGLVTKVPEIILFKENPSFETLNTNVNNFLISSDNQKVLIETQVNQSWSYLLQEASTFKNPTTLFSQSSLTDKKIVPIFQQWQDENKRILFTASTSLGNRALIVQYNNLAKPTILNLALEKDIEKITFLPNDLTKLVYLKAGNLYSLDYQATQPARKLLANQTTWFEATQDNLYGLTNAGFFVKFNLPLNSQKENLNQGAFATTSNSKFKIYDQGGDILILLNQSIYSLKNKELVKLPFAVQGVDNSQESSKFVFWGNQEIWLLDNSSTEKTPRFLNRFWKSPNAVSWLNNNYLIFSLEDDIKITELDERDYSNVFNLKTFKAPKIYFNHFDKKLYVLSENTLLTSERLLP